MTAEREQQVQAEVWELLDELRRLHTERTGHPVWTHRRPLDTASLCHTCAVGNNPNRGQQVAHVAAPELGARYADTASEFAGVATSVAHYLGGEVKVQLTRISKDDKPVEIWFAWSRLAAASREMPGNHI